MGLELVEQLGWDVPDVIFYPTGGGTGLVGMWKAFNELVTMGWLPPGKLPRMVAVQAAGCAPIVKAWEDGAEHAELWTDIQTMPTGIRVPAAIGDFVILRSVRDSDGFAIAVSDEEITAAQSRVPAVDGLLLCPEGAATVAAYLRALDEGRIERSDRAVLWNCGSGLKYPMPPAERTLDRHQPIEWKSLASG